jgi:molybdopterin synthase catalytic subunit
VRAELRSESFAPYAEIERYEQERRAPGAHGAAAVFVGSMRDFNEGETVRSMELEHYPGMTERYLEAIGAEAAERWPIDDALIVHRVGRVEPGDAIVVVAAWSAHRAAALAACRYLIEELKTRAPFWKKEQTESGSRWVATNTPATDSSARSGKEDAA